MSTDIAKKLIESIGKQGDEVVTDSFNQFVKTLVTPRHLSVSWGDRLLTLDKNMGFIREEKFSQAFNEVYGSHTYDQYNGPHYIAWRLNTLVWAARCGMRLEGDFVECGVFKGDMAYVIASVVDPSQRGKLFWLYDSFDGFSRDYSSDDDFPLNPGFLDFADKIYKDKSIWTHVQRRFSTIPCVNLVRGFLPETLDHASPDKIAFMHIDLNSPMAEIGVLNKLFDRVSPGGVIVFDDYGWIQFHKQKDAIDEFMLDRGLTVLEIPTGQGVIVKP